jgi:exonuclease SbcC
LQQTGFQKSFCSKGLFIRRSDQMCHFDCEHLRIADRISHFGPTIPNDGTLPVIKRIELINFMSHKHTVIEPSAGLTVLIGPNNCGKSAIVTALQILCHNLNSTYVLRHGEKECQIIVETDDGHRIEWSRKKSGSPKYVIDGKEFDRLKGGVPEELSRALRLPRVESGNEQLDVHFGEQKNPVFLLNDPGKTAAQFFASSSDASRLVEMQAVHKNRIRNSRSERSRLTTQSSQIETAIENLEPIRGLQEAIQKCETQFCDLSNESATIDELQINIRAIEEQTLESLQLAGMQKALDLISDPPEFVETKPLEQLIDGIKETQLDFNQTEELEKALSQLNEPPTIEPIEPIRETIVELRQSNSLHEQLRRSQDRLQNLCEPPVNDEDIVKLEQLLIEAKGVQSDLNQAQELATKTDTTLQSIQEEISVWAKANPACPTCGGEVDAEQILLGAASGTGGHAHG